MSSEFQKQIWEEYSKLRPNLEKVMTELECYLLEVFGDLHRIDSIRVRVKEVESFVKKTIKFDEETGELKYKNPLREIQDQIGARIVTFYKSDIERIRTIALDNFREVEDQRKIPDDVWKFGYEARHLLCLFPPGIQNQYKPHIEFFELQLCTLFQHAWSQANHDLTYKPADELKNDIEGKLHGQLHRRGARIKFLRGCIRTLAVTIDDCRFNT